MTQPEQLLVVTLVALIIFALLALRLFRQLRRPDHLRRAFHSQKPYRQPPTSDGLSMAASQALAKAEITARNAHDYQIDDLPPELDRLTLYRYYWEFREEGVGGAYLYPGIRSRDECRGRGAAAPYYHHKLAIWSWDGSHYEFSNAALQGEIKARFERMLTVLQQGGWQTSSSDAETTLLHLYGSPNDSPA